MASTVKPSISPLKPIILLALLAGMLALVHFSGAGAKLGEFRLWIRSFGLWAPLVFAVVYAFAVTALVPGSAMTIAAGALFGTAEGVVIVSFASTAGAALSFLISRYFARAFVEGILRGNKKFARLDDLAAKNGPVIVALTRLIPLFPFTILNYGFGLTKIRFSTYIFWSWLCMIPGTVLYVAGSDAVFRFAESGKINIVIAAVFGVFTVLLFLLVRYARALLKAKEGGTGKGL